MGAQTGELIEPKPLHATHKSDQKSGESALGFASSQVLPSDLRSGTGTDRERLRAVHRFDLIFQNAL